MGVGVGVAEGKYSSGVHYVRCRTVDVLFS